MRMRHALFAMALAVVSGVAKAEEPWRVIPAESSLSFEARDSQGGPIAGGFSKMTGSITGDPDHLSQSRIKIDVDLASLSADMRDTVDTLATAEWFDTLKFPQAVYESRNIVKRPDGRYEAEGDLALRGVKAPVTLLFNFPVYGPKPGAPGTLRAVAKGTAHLSRAAFKLGGPDYAKQVMDAVEVTFTLTAERAK